MTVRLEGQKGHHRSNPNAKWVLSFGAGKNSTALLVRWIREGRRLDLVIFSDTGDEMDGSWEVASHAMEICKREGIPHTIVQDPDQLHGRFRRLRVIPLPHRNNRSCTATLKVDPIKRELRKRGWHKTGVVMLIGIATEEAHRMKDELPLYAEPWWPLIYDFNMDRAACDEEIAAHWDGPKVEKSGCKGCPFIGIRGFLELARTDRTAFHRWRKTEETARNFPKNRLFQDGPTLAEIEHRADTEQRLDVWVRPDIECGVGTCPTDDMAREIVVERQAEPPTKTGGRL